MMLRRVINRLSHNRVPVHTVSHNTTVHKHYTLAMSDSELLNEVEAFADQDSDDDDVPQHNPVLRGWNRYAAEGYNIVNNKSRPPKINTEGGWWLFIVFYYFIC